MKRIINNWSSIRLKNMQRIKETILMDPIFLVSFIISSCILKYYFSMDSKWIIKFIFGYLIGTLYIIYKNNKKESIMFIAHKFTREIFIYLIFIILVYFLDIIQIENVFDTRNYILNFMGSDTPEGSETGKDSEIKDEDKGSKDGMTINISKEAMMEAAKILGDAISQILPVVDESSKIPSILEGEMSPLFYLLSYNLILGLLILLHIIIILIILGYKYEYIPVRRVFSYIINRIWSKKENLLKKFEEIRNKIEIFGGIYLNVLLKINVISIILDLLLIIYINYDLLANLDNYVIVHNYLNNLN